MDSAIEILKGKNEGHRTQNTNVYYTVLKKTKRLAKKNQGSWFSARVYDSMAVHIVCSVGLIRHAASFMRGKRLVLKPDKLKPFISID